MIVGDTARGALAAKTLVTTSKTVIVASLSRVSELNSIAIYPAGIEDALRTRRKTAAFQ